MIEVNIDTVQEEQLSQEAINAQVYNQKWDEYRQYCNSLTITSSLGNKYAANPEALKEIEFRRDSTPSGVSVLWVEDWASFNTDKVELQEVYDEAGRLTQEKLQLLFGA